MKGYKVFNPDWTCRDRQYSCPGVFKQEGELKMCKNGIHFCKELISCFNYYVFSPKNKVAEIEAIGEIIKNEFEGKYCTSKIKIVRELTWHEVLDLVNSGDYNTGFENSGNYNTGNFNTGIRNSGDYNSGMYNTSEYNSGDFNTGNSNTGNYNSGNFNTGNCNSGHYNSGHCNTGSLNTGNFNTGNCNSGHYNSGHCNTGSLNTGSYNSGNFNTGNFNAGSGSFGCFNTSENKMIFFNKPSDWTYKDWIESRANEILSRMEVRYLDWIPGYSMTEEDKEKYPEYKVTNGFLKHREKAELNLRRQKWWENALSKMEKEIVLNLPNFDAKIFKQITGIDVTIEK